MHGIFKENHSKSTDPPKNTLESYAKILLNLISFSDIAWLFIYRIHKWDKETFCMKTGLHESYYDNIRDDKDRSFCPKKSKVLSICLGLGHNRIWTHILLLLSGNLLNPFKSIDYIYLQIIKMDKKPDWTIEDYNDLIDQYATEIGYKPIRDDYFGSMSNIECRVRKKKKTK